MLNEFLSYCQDFDPQFNLVINSLCTLPNVETYVSGGTLTIFCLNKFKDKQIPECYLEDIDIFVKATNIDDVVEFLEDNFGYRYQVTSEYKELGSFVSLISDANKINVIISEDSLDTVLARFDLNCNTVGVNLTTSEFYYSNTFINFLEDEILKFNLDNVKLSSLKRVLYKVSQYKLSSDSISTEELHALFSKFPEHDYINVNMGRKKSSELKDLTYKLVRSLYMLDFHNYTNPTEFSLRLASPSQAINNSPERILLYRAKEIEF